MRRMKIAFAWIVCLALVLTCLALPQNGIRAFADETEEVLSYTYEGHTFLYEAGDDGITITGCEDESAETTVTELTLPESIDGTEVTGIGESAFYGYEVLTEITLPDTITEIGSSAFYGCGNLTSVDLPDGITEISNSLFRNCTELVSVDFPENLKSIGRYAFYNCAKLDEVLFPDTLTSIQIMAFYNCTDISYIRLPASNLAIYDGNFGQSTNVETLEYAEGCTKPYTTDSWQDGMGFLAYVKTVILPSTITTINTGTTASGYTGSINDTYFSAFSSVEEFVISEENPYFAVYDNCIYDKDLITLYIVPKMAESVEFAPDCTTIKSGAFSSCDAITEVTVPDTVTTLEGTVSSTNSRYGAFTSCDALETLVIPESVTTIEAGAVYDCGSLTDVSLFIDGVYYHFTGENSEYVKTVDRLDIVLGEGASAEITDAVFAVFTETSSSDPDDTEDYCDIETQLETIVFPAGTTAIQQDLFDYMSALTAIEVEEGGSVYYSENGILYQYAEGESCADVSAALTLVRYPLALGSVSLAENLTEIAPYAFYNCTGIKTIEFPSTLTTVDSYAFYKCKSMDVTFADGLTSIGEYAFYSGLNSSVYLPESVSSIGTDAFYTLDASLTLTVAAGSYAEEYASANGITYVTYGEAAQDDPDDEKSATGADIGTTVTVGSAAYKVTASNAVTYVKSMKKNTSKVTIPATVKINGKTYKVTAVAASAFAKNAKLKTVVIGKNVKTIGKKAFYNCKNLKKITFKDKNVKTIGTRAFKGTAAKATVQCPKAKKAAYKKLLKKAGLSAKAKFK